MFVNVFSWFVLNVFSDIHLFSHRYSELLLHISLYKLCWDHYVKCSDHNNNKICLDVEQHDLTSSLIFECEASIWASHCISNYWSCWFELCENKHFIEVHDYHRWSFACHEKIMWGIIGGFHLRMDCTPKTSKLHLFSTWELMAIQGNLCHVFVTIVFLLNHRFWLGLVNIFLD